MSAKRLSRSAGDGRAAAPVRLVHLGLGNFYRSHQCAYTDRAPDAEDWGYAAFQGIGAGPLVDDLNAQEGLYTLVTRGADRDRHEVVGSLSRAHGPLEHEAWLGYLADPRLAAVTLTVTEAGYVRGAHGGLDTARPEVQVDVEALRRDPTAVVGTAPARLVAGLAARRRADAGALVLVPCDNMPGNGALARRVVTELAELVDPQLASWLEQSLAVVTTMVDRITPVTAPQDVRSVGEATGREDRCPVVAEPFHEWVLSGSFPTGRPRWEDAGATFTDDVTPYEQRKLWLLNGGHSLLGYTGSIRGHDSVDEAVDDDTCRGWLEEWWTVASRHLDQQPEALTAYRAALLERFANARMHDRLDRIAMDGSQKLPVCILPVLRAERSAGRTPEGATRTLAAWVCHLRGLGAPISDVRADEIVPFAEGPLAQAVPRVLARLDPALGDDAEVVATVVEQSDELTRQAAR